MTEQELGAAMLAHEKKICRAYLEVGRDTRPFPNRTPRALEIVKHIYDLPYGEKIRTRQLHRRFRHATVHNVVRKLVACDGLTHVPNTENPRWYVVTKANQEVVEQILYQ